MNKRSYSSGKTDSFDSETLLRRPGPPAGRAQGRNRVLGSRGHARQHCPRGRAASAARERLVEQGPDVGQRAGDDEAGDGDGAQRGRGPV